MREHYTDKGLRVLHIDTWQEFERIVAKHNHHYIYRGQRDPKWKLQSPWERNPAIQGMKECFPERPVHDGFVSGAYEANQNSYFHRFKGWASQLAAVDVGKLRTENEWWAWGRDYELITPLLDWTRVARIAAFFALTSYVEWICDFSVDEAEESRRRSSSRAVAIWMLDASEDTFDKDRFELIEASPGFEKRQCAQKGVFTRLYGGMHLDVQSHLTACKRLGKLRRIDLSTRDTETALKALHDAKIHYATMYPDAWGAAKYANTRRFVVPETMGELFELNKTCAQE